MASNCVKTGYADEVVDDSRDLPGLRAQQRVEPKHDGKVSRRGSDLRLGAPRGAASDARLTSA